jgi:hypothetical protein
MSLLVIAIATITALGTLDAAAAQGMGMMGSGTDQQPADHGMADHGMMGHRMGGGMRGGMGNDMICPMMRSGMMQGGMMGSGMMGSGMAGGGMSAPFGSRVTPVMNLSVDDVRGYLASQLERLNNKRLKLGAIKTDDATITADIVTVDNSLVQQLKIDRHTGAITYEN